VANSFLSNIKVSQNLGWKNNMAKTNEIVDQLIVAHKYFQKIF